MRYPDDRIPLPTGRDSDPGLSPGKAQRGCGAGAVIEARRRSTQGDTEGSCGEVRQRGRW